MTKRRRRRLAVAILALLVGAASAGGWFWRLDRGVVDAFFLARHAVGMDPPLDARVQLVNLDPEVTEEIGQPVSRWCDDYARAIRSLLEQGAAAVALDIVYAPALTKLPPRKPTPSGPKSLS